MSLTKEFTKALYGLFLFSLFLYGLDLFLESNNLIGYSISEKNSNLRIISNYIFALLPIFAFWFAVAFITKDVKTSLLAFAFTFFGHGFMLYDVMNKGVFSDSFIWIITLTTLISYLVFGLIHFKSIKGLWILTIFFVGHGFILIGREYFDILNQLLKFVGLRDILEVKIPSGEKTHKIINILELLTRKLQLPLLFVIFYFIFSKINSSEKVDFSLRTIEVSKIYNWKTYSIIYWVFRLTLIVSVFGIVFYVKYFIREEGLTIKIIFSILSFIIAIFMTASLYRNYVSSYFISKGRYPGLLYLFLNIPFLNVIAWIISVVISSKKIEINNTNIDSDIALVKAKIIQKTFIKQKRNDIIKIFIILFMTANLIGKVIGNNKGIGISYEIDKWEYVAFYLISIILTIWYMSDNRAIFILFGLQSFLILLLTLINMQELLLVTATSGLINMFFYYSIFHFDKLKFRNEDS